MFDVVWQGVGILAMFGFVAASVYVLDRLKKAERRAQDQREYAQQPVNHRVPTTVRPANQIPRPPSARLETQEEHEHGND